jgi:hypothetical protein
MATKLEQLKNPAPQSQAKQELIARLTATAQPIKLTQADRPSR